MIAWLAIHPLCPSSHPIPSHFILVFHILVLIIVLILILRYDTHNQNSDLNLVTPTCIEF